MPPSNPSPPPFSKDNLYPDLHTAQTSVACSCTICGSIQGVFHVRLLSLHIVVVRGVRAVMCSSRPCILMVVQGSTLDTRPNPGLLDLKAVLPTLEVAAWPGDNIALTKGCVHSLIHLFLHKRVLHTPAPWGLHCTTVAYTADVNTSLTPCPGVFLSEQCRSTTHTPAITLSSVKNVFYVPGRPNPDRNRNTPTSHQK